MKTLSPFIIWLCVFILLFSFKFIFTSRWDSFSLARLQLKSETQDCKNKNLSKNIEIRKQNVEKLFHDGHVNVLIGSGDGCYKINTRLQVFSIVRTIRSRKVFLRHLWAPAIVDIIVEYPFEKLDSDRKTYVLNKFGAEASKMSFLELVLSIEGRKRPEIYSKFPIEHPLAQAILQKDMAQVTHEPSTQILNPDKILSIPSVEIVDPENKDYGDSFHQMNSEIGSKIKRVIILSKNQTDFRAYNAATILAISSRKLEVILAYEKIIKAPQKIWNLNTVSCWEAIEALNSNTLVGQFEDPKDSQIWFGDSEVDTSYAIKLEQSLKKYHIRNGLWFPGSSEQLAWCRKFYAEHLYEQNDFE